MIRWGKYSISRKKMLQKYPNNILKKHFVESSVLPSRFQSEAIYSIKDLWIKRKNQYEEDCLLYNDDFYLWMYMDEIHTVSFRCDNISLSTLGLYAINTGSNMYKIPISYNNLTRINRSTKSKLCNGLTYLVNQHKQDPTDQQDRI